MNIYLRNPDLKALSPHLAEESLVQCRAQCERGRIVTGVCASPGNDNCRSCPTQMYDDWAPTCGVSKSLRGYEAVFSLHY